ncbi:hypothetical protein [Bacillus phage vB_BtM_BMBsp2]|nr:hypothetical protein [Bacillus phage vB_BtM_BMBsp2]
MSEVKKDEIIAYLAVNVDHQKFLDDTTNAIRKYESEGYDMETNYQVAADPRDGSIIHSAYVVGKLKKTEPLIDSFELGRLEEWIEQEYTMGEMPNGAYNTIQDLLAHYRTK